jgi:cytochrome c-type biogenesis protein CcmE
MMHPVRKQRLVLVLFIVFFSSIAISLVTYALRENINLFYPPSKIIAGNVPINKQIRAGGCVVPGSVIRQGKSLAVQFNITDGSEDLLVNYEGILPDLFTEGEAVVVNGKVTQNGHFMATEVLAKHDENYMPPEVAEAMKTTGEHAKTCDLI